MRGFYDSLFLCSNHQINIFCEFENKFCECERTDNARKV